MTREAEHGVEGGTELVSLLEQLGVPTRLRDAYLELLATDDHVPSPVAAEELVRAGLAQTAPGGPLRPVPPRWAIATVVQRRRQELATEESALASVAEAAQRVQADYERLMERRGDRALIELLRSPEAAFSALDALAGAARRSILALQPGPTSRERHEMEPRDLLMLEAGVAMRTIYSSVYLAEPGALAMVRKLAEAGEVARVHEGLPMPMLVVDEDVAVLPVDRDSTPADGAAIVRSTAVVRACVALFEALWLAAAPFDPDLPAEDPKVAEIARLLLMGLQDERIAREVDLSVRTVRRRIRELMDTHGARSRTQLGAQLARAMRG